MYKNQILKIFSQIPPNHSPSFAVCFGWTVTNSLSKVDIYKGTE